MNESRLPEQSAEEQSQVEADINHLRRRVLQANKDKQLWALLTYLLCPLAIVTVPLWLFAIRRERRLIMEIAPLVGVRTDQSHKTVRLDLALHLNSEDLEEETYGPVVVLAVLAAIAIFIVVRVLTAS